MVSPLEDSSAHMDASEKSVCEYLTHRGFDNLRYEPDGKVPPDFVVNDSVAIEVRRLNQNDETQSGRQGLEEVAMPLDSLFRQVLPSFGPPTAGESWFVNYSFRRPLPPRNYLKQKLTNTLVSFRDQSIHQPMQLHVIDNLELGLIKASKVYSSFYVLGGSSDDDGGGPVVAEMERNLRICISEKTTKVARIRSKYPEWWLVLVDYIGYGILDGSDREQLRERVRRIKHDWDKIILVNPLNSADAFEL